MLIVSKHFAFRIHFTEDEYIMEQKNLLNMSQLVSEEDTSEK